MKETIDACKEEMHMCKQKQCWKLGGGGGELIQKIDRQKYVCIRVIDLRVDRMDRMKA